MKTIYLFRHSKPLSGNQYSNREIPLAPEGRVLMERLIKEDHIQVSKVYASTYLRAKETADTFLLPIILEERLKERQIGVRETFTSEMWEKQYRDLNCKNAKGESFYQVNLRMRAVLSEILMEMEEEESVAVVSHAAAICAYLLTYCTIEVVDAKKKIRKITCQDKVILEGTIETPSYFRLEFEGDLPAISYHQAL